MKLLLLCLVLAFAAAESGFYDVASYCTTTCPKTQMTCPYPGYSAAQWTRNSTSSIKFSIYSVEGQWVNFNINMDKQYNSSLNAILHPTINKMYYYFLPCAFTFNSYQNQYYARYCYDSYGRWDTERIFITKGYFEVNSAFQPLAQCNFVLTNSTVLLSGTHVEEKADRK